jgi:hypothetical protein
MRIIIAALLAMCMVMASVSAANTSAQSTRIDFTLRKMVEDIELTFTFDNEQKVGKMVSYIQSWQEDEQAAGNYAYTVITEYKDKISQLLPKIETSSTTNKAAVLSQVKDKLTERGIDITDLDTALQQAQEKQTKLEIARQLTGDN